MIKLAKSLKDKTSCVVILFDDTEKKQLSVELPADYVSLIQAYKKAKKCSADSITNIQLHPEPNSPKLVLINLGKESDYQLKCLRKLVANAARSLAKESTLQWCCINAIHGWENHVAQAIVMAEYVVPNSKSNQTPESYPKHIFISNQKKMVQEGYAIGLAVNKARTFANAPANILTTSSFVDEIKRLFKGDSRYKITILNEADMKKKKMMALLGVGQGSKYPSYLVDVTYDGGGKDHVALVGKGVMFDTGGISIKPSARMREMKGDMGGAAAVIASAWAAGELNVKRKVSFIVPIVENMVSKDAQRPGDVVIASNGTSIEITNTDAEGRLILADALVYATKKKVNSIVDIATLTGASVIALGPYATAVLGNHQGVIEALISAGCSLNEPLWALPLFDEYKDLLKSDVADILNANEGREAGTITAAKFLEQFVGDTPWAHLDIASTMSASSSKGERVKGMTGSGTRTLIAYILNDKIK
ncbi:MAG: leucyl aminopeptidase family protein [Candidatus Margulisiibacteriota bacterium]